MSTAIWITQCDEKRYVHSLRSHEWHLLSYLFSVSTRSFRDNDKDYSYLFPRCSIIQQKQSLIKDHGGEVKFDRKQPIILWWRKHIYWSEKKDKKNCEECLVNVYKVLGRRSPDLLSIHDIHVALSVSLSLLFSLSVSLTLFSTRSTRNSWSATLWTMS